MDSVLNIQHGERTWPCAVRPGFVVFKFGDDRKQLGKFYGARVEKGKVTGNGDICHLTRPEIIRNAPRIWRIDEDTGQRLPATQIVPQLHKPKDETQENPPDPGKGKGKDDNPQDVKNRGMTGTRSVKKG